MGSSYHQSCPVAKALELLDERWTLLIVRQLSLFAAVAGLAGQRQDSGPSRGAPSELR